MQNDLMFLAMMPVSQFKAFKRMVNTLMRLGIERDTAVMMILSVMQTAQHERNQRPRIRG